MRLIFLIVVYFYGLDIALANCQKKASPSSQFILKDGEAFDRVANLTWSRCSVGSTWDNGRCNGVATQMSFNEAKEHAQKQGNGWRIPTILELYSLIENTCTAPTINSVVFPDIKDWGGVAPYWSNTYIKEMPSLIYYIDFQNGHVDGHTENFFMAVRLVHSGK